MAAATEGLEKLEDMIVRQAEATGTQVAAAKAAIGNVIFGQERVVEQALITVLCGGHALLIGLPGLAKTKLVETMGIVLGLDARRIQFTPDLMPSDILGSEVLEENPGGKRSFRFIPGPIFCQLLMADEINRASPRTQSALLQAMQEHHVTVAGNRHDVPRPFHVLATQNPIEQEGTYPLPEAQLDRFLMQIDVDYPDHEAERKIVFDTTGTEENKPKPTMTADELLAAQRLVRRLPVGESVVEAILNLVRSARPGPQTGEIACHYQYTPNDPYDYDSVAENVLVDIPGPSGPRKLALEADRNGFAYAIDRTTGKFVWGLPFVKKVTWTKGLDPESGKPIEYDPNKSVQTYIASVTPSRTNMETDICPGNMGGKNWPPTAYNPDLKLWYIPVIESCNRIKVEVMTPDKLKPREFWTGGGPSQPFKITGSVTAIDVTTGKIAAKMETPFPNLGGMLATPDLVFTGEPSGEVTAHDAKSLQKLWEFNTGGGVNAPPMTFTVDGKQYVAILVGLGGAWDKWFIDSTPELKKIQPGSMLYVFAL